MVAPEISEFQVTLSWAAQAQDIQGALGVGLTF
jgi:hypothetical protein